MWEAILSKGLKPSQASINVTQWLEQQRASSNDMQKCIYLTNQLYANFSGNNSHGNPTEFRESKLNLFFRHDDQDQKQRTMFIRKAVAELLSKRVEPADSDAKSFDV